MNRPFVFSHFSAVALVLLMVLAITKPHTTSAAENPKFSTGEALVFLNDLVSIEDCNPDINLLAKLFNSRYSPGAGNGFVEDVETFVAAGLLDAGRKDLYGKRIKPICKVLDVDNLEWRVSSECRSCNGGKIRKLCERCAGSGKCKDCAGRGSIPSNITTFGDKRTIQQREGNHWRDVDREKSHPSPPKYIMKKCLVCRETGRCPDCNGEGQAEKDCPNCNGKGRITDAEKARSVFLLSVVKAIYTLCDIGENMDIPASQKNEFKIYREKAKMKFPNFGEEEKDENPERQTKFLVDSTSQDGTSIGFVKKGDVLVIQYLSGEWTIQKGRFDYQSPDADSHKPQVNTDLVSKSSGSRWALPSGTHFKPFVLVVTVPGEYVLQIRDIRAGMPPKEVRDNDGQVEYGVTVFKGEEADRFMSITLFGAYQGATKATKGGAVTIKSWIDGGDYIHIRDNEVWFVHEACDLPGRNGKNDFPTYVNGVAWKPKWEGGDKPKSNTYTIPKAVPSLIGAKVFLRDDSQRGRVHIVEQPSEENEYTLKLHMGDHGQGASWCEFTAFW